MMLFMVGGNSIITFLETIYYSFLYQRCLHGKIIKILPSNISLYEQPFIALSYIDDMMRFNGISETRNEIEKMLAFYE